MITFGLTGDVGMGKSTAAELLRARGARIVDADEIARQLVEPGKPALAEIQNVFGKEIISPDGNLRRDELARIVFADATARKKLEVILHFRIRERWLAQIETWRRENSALAVAVIPLLFETGAESYFDKIICVACSEIAQRERLIVRGWNLEQIKQRIAAQMPIEKKMVRANFVVWTEGSQENHAKQIDRIFAGL